MNKLTKIGCSALCGSLAAISSANAGDLTVTGGADLTWISLGDSETGNPIGMGSNLTFKGSGEADNGWTWDLTIAHKNGNAYSAAKIDIGMGGLGNFMINQGDGNGLGAYDDKMPTAWEEPWGAGLNPDVQLVGGIGSSMNVQYTTPKVLGTTIVLAYAPEVGASDTADKTSSGAASNELMSGWDAIVHMNPTFGAEALSGLNLYLGGSYREKTVDSGTYQQDQGDGTAQITLDLGPVSIGYGVSGIVTGYEARGTAGKPDFYKSHMYGVAFNVNDDLSLSYGYHDTRMEGVTQRDGSLNDEQNRYVEVESWQVAYTMGGASFRLADVEAKNVGFSNATSADRDATVISVGLAF